MNPLELALRYLTTDFQTIAQVQAQIPYPKPAFFQLYEAFGELVTRGEAVRRMSRPVGVHRQPVDQWKLTSPGVLAQQALGAE